jgi:hypothetical protein
MIGRLSTNKRGRSTADVVECYKGRQYQYNEVGKSKVGAVDTVESSKLEMGEGLSK